jgi:hypothetical protein
MSVERASGFFVLSFGMDGESVGSGFWERSRLSENWLGTCKDYLGAHGESFDASWNAHLSHIQTKLTSASGAGLVTFFVHGKVVLSVLLLSGLSPPAENPVAEMFIESLKKTVPVEAATRSSSPFRDIFAVRDRPLMVVVPWPEATVSSQDHALVRELGLHLAGAFFAM